MNFRLAFVTMSQANITDTDSSQFTAEDHRFESERD